MGEVRRNRFAPEESEGDASSKDPSRRPLERSETMGGTRRGGGVYGREKLAARACANKLFNSRPRGTSPRHRDVCSTEMQRGTDVTTDGHRDGPSSLRAL